MIKLLKILLLGLMFGGNAFSFGLPKDVGSGNSYTKSLGSGQCHWHLKEAKKILKLKILLGKEDRKTEISL